MKVSQALLLDALREMRRDAPEGRFSRRARVWFSQGRARRGARANSTSRRPVAWISAVAAAALGLLAVRIGGHSTSRSVSGEAQPPSALELPELTAVGAEALFSLDGRGPWRVGDPLPQGIPLRAAPGREAAIAIARHAEIRLDPGAEVAIEQTVEKDSLTVSRGRISIGVQPSHRALEVRIAGAETVLLARSAAFAVLVGSESRWSTAVSRGDVGVARQGGRHTIRSGETALGRADGTFEVRTTAPSLELDARLVEVDRRWIVEGLTDLFAQVEVAGRDVVVGEDGRFRAHSDGEALVWVTAVDAAGHRAERRLAVPTSMRNARAVRVSDGAASMSGVDQRPDGVPTVPAPDASPPPDPGRRGTSSADDGSSDPNASSPLPGPIRPRPLDWESP